MHDPAMTNTTALTKGTSYLRKYVLKAKQEHSGRFVLNDSARTRPSSWRRCDDVLDYIWRQKVLLQDKTSKIEKLQQLLHSERQRTHGAETRGAKYHLEMAGLFDSRPGSGQAPIGSFHTRSGPSEA